MTRRRYRPRPSCEHWNGTQFVFCRAGVEYAALEANGKLPCYDAPWPASDNAVCKKFEPAKPEASVVILDSHRRRLAGRTSCCDAEIKVEDKGTKRTGSCTRCGAAVYTIDLSR